MTVLTVLFCAMLPAGLPQTAAHGSAFNPATTSVALAARGPQRRWAVEQRITPDPVNAQQIGLTKLVVPFPVAVTAESGSVAATGAVLFEAPALHARALLAAHRARAPPSA